MRSGGMRADHVPYRLCARKVEVAYKIYVSVMRM